MPKYLWILVVPALPDGGLGPIPPSDLGFDPLDIAMWIGVLAPFIVAVALRFNWSSAVKFWVALGLMVLLSIFAWWTTSYPAVWEMIATQLAIIFAASQVVYRALKPSGVLEWLEYKTTPASGTEGSPVPQVGVFPTRQSLHGKQ